jgi:hypothetical protein
MRNLFPSPSSLAPLFPLSQTHELDVCCTKTKPFLLPSLPPSYSSIPP